MELNSRFAFLFYLPNYNHHPKNAKRKLRKKKKTQQKWAQDLNRNFI